jgi:hypothetical protein
VGVGFEGLSGFGLRVLGFEFEGLGLLVWSLLCIPSVYLGALRFILTNSYL